MTNRTIAAVVALVFAIALAVVLGTRLSGQAAAIAFGAVAGVITGVPTGLAAAYVAHRRGWFGQQNESAPPVQQVAQIDWQGLEPGTLVLTPEQAEVLGALLQRIDSLNAMTASSGTVPSASQPGNVLTRPPARQRDISIVGGADLSQTTEE